jgi:hypothetical protein
MLHLIYSFIPTVLYSFRNTELNNPATQGAFVCTRIFFFVTRKLVHSSTVFFTIKSAKGCTKNSYSCYLYLYLVFRQLLANSAAKADGDQTPHNPLLAFQIQFSSLRRGYGSFSLLP